jgi:hypothetical protein
VNQNELYSEILRDVGVTGLAPADALWFAVILHTHRIVLRPEVELEECRDDEGLGPISLLPISVSHTAEVLAPLWPETDERGRRSFWHFLYLSVTPYEVLAEIPPALRPRADEARRQLAAHRFVAELTED